jgi:hypothetical protein
MTLDIRPGPPSTTDGGAAPGISGPAGDTTAHILDPTVARHEPRTTELHPGPLETDRSQGQRPIPIAILPDDDEVARWFG